MATHSPQLETGDFPQLEAVEVLALSRLVVAEEQLPKMPVLDQSVR